MLAAEQDGRQGRPGAASRILGQLVLAPVAIGVIAGLRLLPLGAPAAAGLGYAAFAAAQIVVATWLFATTRTG